MTSDAASVIESRIIQARAAIDALQMALRTHQRDLGPDATHWLRDLDEQIEAFGTALDLMSCEQCAALATWLHPDGWERYCDRHAAAFAPCGVCEQWMPVADMVGDPAGHASCGERI